MAKKSISDWYGPNVLSGRDSQTNPHKTSNVGSEGPKRLTGMPKKKIKSTKQPMAPAPLVDKYGRKISRTEYMAREKFRASKKSGSTPSDTSIMDKNESMRRKNYRMQAPDAVFRTVEKNIPLPYGLSSRKVNAATSAAAKKTAGTADAKTRAATAARKKVVTKYIRKSS